MEAQDRESADVGATDAARAIEVVRRAHELWNANDAGPLRDVYTDDVVAQAGMHVLKETHGVDELMAYFASVFEMFAWSEVVPEEFIVLGEAIAVPSIWRGQMEGSTAAIEQRLVTVYWVRGEQISRVAYFPDLDEAHAAVAPDG